MVEVAEAENSDPLAQWLGLMEAATGSLLLPHPPIPSASGPALAFEGSLRFVQYFLLRIRLGA